jgi:hypothetical protein
MSVSGPNSEVELADANFRFTPESRHPAVGLGCPFGANIGSRRSVTLVIAFSRSEPKHCPSTLVSVLHEGMGPGAYVV